MSRTGVINVTTMLINAFLAIMLAVVGYTVMRVDARADRMDGEIRDTRMNQVRAATEIIGMRADLDEIKTDVKQLLKIAK